MVWPLDENQGVSQLHGHDPCLVCEVALYSPISVGYHLELHGVMTFFNIVLVGFTLDKTNNYTKQSCYCGPQ